MLRIDDFILYLPMAGNTTDYSLNGYSSTGSSGLSLTSNKDGVSNMAYNFNATSDYLEYSNVAGDEMRDAIANESLGIYMNLYITDTNFSTGRLYSQWGNSGNRSFRLSYTALSGASNDGLTDTISSDGTNNTYNNSNVIDVEYMRGQWNRFRANYTTSVVITVNGTELINGSIDAPFNGTASFRIGQDDSSTANSFYGDVFNFIASTRTFTELDEKFIEKFGNMKRIA